MCNFTVGQKVVCVDDEFSSGKHPALRKGDVYTISSISKSQGRRYPGDISFAPRGPRWGAKIALQLVEIPGTYHWPDGLMTDRFDASRFRPLVTKKTDISIFTEMLKTKEKETTQ